MENSLGNFREYMDAFEKYDNLCGGYIWDFVDQAIHKVNEDGEDMWLYGTDYDEKESWILPPYNTCAITGSNVYFNANGIIAADRKIHPSIHEVRKVYCEVEIKAIDAARGSYILKNKQLFSDLSKFDIKYLITENGEKLSEGLLDRALFEKLAPLSQMDLKLDCSSFLDRKGEVIITFSYIRREACRFAEAGYEQGWDQFILKAADERKRQFTKTALKSKVQKRSSML
jgi:beta-galactosidase